MPSIPLEQVCPDACDGAIALLSKFLVYPSRGRITAKMVSYLREEYKFNYILGAFG